MATSKFVKDHLIDYKWATEHEVKQGWNVEGILKNRSNEILKFDLRPLKKYDQGIGKTGSTSSKADKMVFEAIDKWIIIDMKEVKRHVLKTKSSLVNLEFILKNLDWNIEIKK
jgi:hypothetical protein